MVPIPSIYVPAQHHFAFLLHLIYYLEIGAQQFNLRNGLWSHFLECRKVAERSQKRERFWVKWRRLLREPQFRFIFKKLIQTLRIFDLTKKKYGLIIYQRIFFFSKEVLWVY